MKLVLDTNVVVSAFISQGAPCELLLTAHKNLIEICTSAELLAELDHVLHRKKISTRLKSGQLDPDELMRQFQRVCTNITVPSPYPRVSRDPKDDMVLACAVSAQATAIVSGDNDLLVLNNYQNIPILRPKQMLRRVIFRRGMP